MQLLFFKQGLSAVKEFADLSEQELDRIETLVQNLLKITRLDAGAIVLEKATENVADMIAQNRADDVANSRIYCHGNGSHRIWFNSQKERRKRECELRAGK